MKNEINMLKTIKKPIIDNKVNLKGYVIYIIKKN